MTMRADYIWMNGKNHSPGTRPKSHVFTHALRYGSSAFEGIRVYETTHGPALFRGRGTSTNGCSTAPRWHAFPSPYTVEEYLQATFDVVRANQQRNAYVRPLLPRLR
jgi:branched-chain amino acid aminotransferase